MSKDVSIRVQPMLNPPHLGELIRENMNEMGWSVTETASYLNCERGTLSRLLNGRSGVSAKMAIELEKIGWAQLIIGCDFKQVTNSRKLVVKLMLLRIPMYL